MHFSFKLTYNENMDIVELLTSLNKIGLVAFLITLGFLLYEIFLFSKAKRAKDKPEVPTFQEGGKSLTPAQSIIKLEKENWNDLLANNSKLVFVILSVLLVIFAAM